MIVKNVEYRINAQGPRLEDDSAQSDQPTARADSPLGHLTLRRVHVQYSAGPTLDWRADRHDLIVTMDTNGATSQDAAEFLSPTMPTGATLEPITAVSAERPRCG